MTRLHLSALILGAALSQACMSPPPPRRRYLPPPPRPKEPEKKDYGRKLPPGQHALRKITDPTRRPEFTLTPQHRPRLLAAVKRSLSYLTKPSSRQTFPKAGIRHDQVVASLEAFKELLASPKTCADVCDEVRRRFDVYTSVGCDDEGTVLFTGYYTPIFQASKTKTAEFQHPLHRLPANHVKDPISGETLGLRSEDGQVDPRYPGRRELLGQNMLAGLELVYLRRAYEAYIIGVQGSAILEMRDGSRFEIGYAGTNGHPYKSIGRAMVAAGKLREDELNLRRMIQYFEEHPGEFEAMAAHNSRYVFFQESEGGPFGCLNEKVSAMASLATDKAIFPRGALCFLTAELPGAYIGSSDYRGFALDQDAGGAIQAPGRCDVFMGIGEEAGRRAGRTLAEGRLYYLFLKESGAEVAMGDVWGE